MRIAVVSDIHGNLTALEAVVADLQKHSPDMVFQGGDLAAFGGHPAEVVDRVRELGWPGVCGNTDEMLWRPEELTRFAERVPKLKKLMEIFAEMIPWIRAALGEERIRWLQTLPNLLRHGDVAIVHASPASLWTAPFDNATDDQLRSAFGDLGAPVAVYSHIHRPFVRKLEGLTVVNTGSAGLPYDGDPRAAYFLLDGANATIRRVEYDCEAEAEALRRSGMPHAEWVSRNLLTANYRMPA